MSGIQMIKGYAIPQEGGGQYNGYGDAECSCHSAPASAIRTISGFRGFAAIAPPRFVNVPQSSRYFQKIPAMDGFNQLAALGTDWTSEASVSSIYAPQPADASLTSRSNVPKSSTAPIAVGLGVLGLLWFMSR